MSLVILRFKQPKTKRYFKVPFGKIGPIIVSLFMIFLIYMWLTHTPGAINIIKLAISLLVLGIPLYFLVEMYHDAPAIIKVNEKLSYILVLFENIFFPISLKRRIFVMLGDLKNKNVLEFGCAVGTLTRRLAKKVLPDGKLYATDFVEHNVKIASKQVKKHKHVIFFHHPHLDHFKTKIKLPQVDALVSEGVLSYLQKPQTVLNHLASKVKKGGRVVFVDYDRFFFFIPNVSWLSDHKKLQRMFTKAGFKVKILTKRGLLWKYIFIHGEKV
jgi:2-polyprenyl-3-methyl-5-hydroxy-6-metoxy-1,4-benzoquinol methylase